MAEFRRRTCIFCEAPFTRHKNSRSGFCSDDCRANRKDQHNARTDSRSTVMTAALPMLLWCPECSERHIDDGDFATRQHHTHACQHCGHVWRPAIIPTVGVKFLPGYKNGAKP